MTSTSEATARDIALPFQSIASIILATLTGVLIALPAAFMTPPPGPAILPLLGAIVGARIGIRKRHSRIFFYLSLCITLILLTVVSTSGFEFP